MAWEIVDVDREKSIRSRPVASVGYQRLSLNVSACNLLGDYEKYKYVELLRDPTRANIIGVRFLIDSTEKSIVIKRKTSGGKIVGGIDISSKHHIEKLFGNVGIQRKTTNYSVTKESENILVVHTK